jgi:hypothetical protein
MRPTRDPAGYLVVHQVLREIYAAPALAYSRFLTTVNSTAVGQKQTRRHAKCLPESGPS